MTKLMFVTAQMTALFLGLTSTAHADFYFQVGDQAEYTYQKTAQATPVSVFVRVKDVSLQSITFESAVIAEDGKEQACETTLQRKDLLQGEVSPTGCSGIDIMLPPSAAVVENRPESVVTAAGEFLSEYTKYEGAQRKESETWTSQEVPVFGVVKQNRGLGVLSLKSFQINQ